jgi:anti-sigma regulatory factor (Ser/Thr protein kinase)
MCRSGKGIPPPVVSPQASTLSAASLYRHFRLAVELFPHADDRPVRIPTIDPMPYNCGNGREPTARAHRSQPENVGCPCSCLVPQRPYMRIRSAQSSASARAVPTRVGADIAWGAGLSSAKEQSVPDTAGRTITRIRDGESMAVGCLTRFTVPATPASVGTARRRLLAILQGWGCRVDHDTAILLLSEVVTNVVLHAIQPDERDGAEILVVVREIDSGVHVAVHDPDGASSHRVGLHRTASATLTENGRGLDLVDALSERWGVTPTDAGKYLYFVLPNVAKNAVRPVSKQVRAHVSPSGAGCTPSGVIADTSAVANAAT